MKQRINCDVAIIGAGFAGSILARILCTRGMRVALIDAARHPRFAIGESSTPIADLLLRRLGQTYQLADLEALSTWGSWQESHPQLACGCKRGFSYFVHQQGAAFNEDRLGEQSLLVAASASDEVADTHWYRADVDQFFHSQAVASGAVDLTGFTVISQGDHAGARYSLECRGDKGVLSIAVQSNWIIDASGRAGVLARLSRVSDLTDSLETSTHCTYAHHRDLGSWTKHLQSAGSDTSQDPFDADDAAQHHLLDRGWVWMLRFNNGITSIGYTTSTNNRLDWSGYPSLEGLFKGSRLLSPTGSLLVSRRIQHLCDPVIDSRRIMMPTAAVTIDPLHSTGIAHALAGVERVASLILESNITEQNRQIDEYRQAVLAEARLLDRLVSTAYRLMFDFDRFTVACMLYFAAAIRCEERIQASGKVTRLWNADDADFVSTVTWACERLIDPASGYFGEISDRLEPWNTAGLLNPACQNRYAYTATKT